jgi:hypothetical protein
MRCTTAPHAAEWARFTDAEFVYQALAQCLPRAGSPATRTAPHPPSLHCVSVRSCTLATVTTHSEPAALEQYAHARAQLEGAEQARGALIEAWHSVEPGDALEAWVLTEPGGTGELRAASYVTDDVGEQLEEHAATFLRSVKAAMDLAVHATATIVCTSFGPVDAALHTMPLTATAAEFVALIPDGSLLGLRPDQVRVLEEFQPFKSDGESAQLIGTHMQHLAGALERLERGDTLVCGWATHTGPEVHTPEGATLLSVDPEPNGPLAAPRPLITFKVDPPEAAPAVQIRPNIALDPIFETAPWPTELDDNLQRRTARILVLARHLIDALERSVSTPTFIQQFGRVDDLAPVAPTGVWKPVVFDSDEQKAEVLEGLSGADLNLGSIRADDGSYTLLRFENGQVVGREIPEVTPPEPSMPLGAGTELAALGAAARWGLPDFVFHPLTIPKGSGFREIGDGTLVSGHRGITLQVKARDGATDNAEREASWLQKKAGEGLRQAYGTVRMLTQHAVMLRNFRDREVPLPGDEIEWAPVIILDHPNPPAGVTPERESELKGLILTRRDWEFLWDQLRSVSAVIEYAHRVAADDRIELGTEVTRYFDLADRDERATPTPMEPWMVEVGATQISGPTLPRDPANAIDTIGHSVFRLILSDIAATDFGGDELTRLDVLSLIDQSWVGHRAELGRTLLRRIDYCALAPADTLRAQHRVTFVDGGKLQLSFSVYSHFTGYHRQIFEAWVLHRRQTFLQQSGATGSDYPWTVAVLLTPRPDGNRLWDTTVLATNGEPAYDDAAYAEIGAAFDRTAGHDEAIS